MDDCDGATRVVDFLSGCAGFAIVHGQRAHYSHMGATITDTILQAGMNYRTVVLPRVQALMSSYPEAITTSGFQKLIAFFGLRNLLRWNDAEKPQRIMELTWLLCGEGLETEAMVREWLQMPGNPEILLRLRGVGSKTVDYLRILVGIPSIAVDRHIKTLLAASGIEYRGYEHAKNTISRAAELMGISYEVFDQAVWQLVSTGQLNNARSGEMASR